MKVAVPQNQTASRQPAPDLSSHRTAPPPQRAPQTIHPQAPTPTPSPRPSLLHYLQGTPTNSASRPETEPRPESIQESLEDSPDQVSLSTASSDANDAQELSARWAAAIAQPGVPLPHRPYLEHQLGQPLGHVRLHTGTSAQTLLHHLGARAATHHHHIVTAEPDPDMATLTHEVVHVLQSERVALPQSAPVAVVAANHPSEQEADTLSAQVLQGKRRSRPILHRLHTHQLALRRTPGGDRPRALQPEHPPSRPQDMPLGLEDLQRTPQPEVEEEAPAAETAPAETAPAETVDVEPESVARPTPEAPQPAQPVSEEVVSAAETTIDGDAEVETPVEAIATPEENMALDDEALVTGVRLPTTTVNRREQTAILLANTQTLWEEGATTADAHEVSPCEGSASPVGHHPFARGPPLEVPGTEEIPDLSDPEPDAVDRRELDRSYSAVQAQLDEVSPDARAPVPGDLDPELEEERRRQLRQVNRELDTAYREDAPQELDIPTVELTEAADKNRAETDKARLESQSVAQQHHHETLIQEDFGEGRLAPEEDPTLGHDVNLDGLSIPQLSPEELGAEVDLERIATEDNLGEIDLDSLIAVQDQDFETAELALAAEGESQRLIDETIAESDRTLGDRCRTAHRNQEQLLSTAEVGVAERRNDWRQDIDQHVSQRTEEGQQLARDKLQHVDELQQNADAEARTTVESAQTEADTQWRETRQRAEQKADESEDQSWWQQGLDFIGEQIEQLTNWIVDFIDACKAAINTLLDQAAEVAHGLVDAAHQAIVGTLDVLQEGLDVIANNLPGELGEIAQEYRDTAFEFLEGVQADVDQWADDLHADIDTTVEDLRTDLNDTLDDLAAGVREVGGMMQSFFENGVMATLRLYFPDLANLIDRGLDWAIDWAAETLEGWIETLFDVTGLENLEQTLIELYDERFCQEETPEEQAEACADFEKKLQDLLGWFDLLLQSPFAQRIQAFLQETRDAAAEEQLDAAEGFFSFISKAARTVQEWWTSIRSTVAEVIEFFGDIAGTIWRHIAIALGLDPNLDPLDALMAGLEALWDGILAVVQPIIDAVREAWRWIREDSFLAPIIEFFSRLPELWNALTRWLGEVTSALGTWLAEAAQALVDLVLPIVQTVLTWASQVMHRAIDRLSAWFNALFVQINALLSWQSVRESLNRLLAVLQRATLPLRLILRAFSDCLIAAMRWGADVVGNLLHYARIFMDVSVGILQALVLFPVMGPIAFVPFLAGAAWLYLVPECYKAPILNFILDLIIRFIRFFPEPADFVFAAIYQGALSFFQALRGAPDPQKVAAINLVASIFAGNAEVAAGFAVGLLEGVWESTGGTILFLLEVVAWLLTLPFRLANWAIGLLSGESTETPESEEAEGEGAEANATEEAVAPEETVIPDETETSEEAETPEETEATEETDVTHAESIADEEDGTETEVSESSMGGGLEGDRPPDAPSELSQLGDTFQRFITEGFNRDDLRQFIDSMRQTLAGMVGQLAEEAARNLLNALNREGTAFSIGRVMGTVVGMIAVEVLLAIFTGGASAGITAAKTAIQGSRLAGRLVGAFRRIRRAIEPLLEMVQRLRGALRGLIGRIRRWFDDILEWIRNIFRRVARRGRGGRGAARRGARGAGRRGAGRGRGRGRRGGRRGGGTGERGILEGLAEGLARAGWTALLPIARLRVVRKRELDQVLARIPRPPGYRVQLSVKTSLLLDNWTVEARVRRRIRPVGVATHGRGWKLRHHLTTWYTTAGDQDRKHRRVVRDADRRIEHEARVLSRRTGDMEAIATRLRPIIQRIERQPSPRLLDGLTFNIQERRPYFLLRGNRRALRYRYTITPNTTEGDIEADIPGLRDTRIRYGGLRHGFGTLMIASPLTINPRSLQGSEPRVSNDVWEDLLLRREGGRSYYVRGHLLNHNIHGPGNTWDNLTPITQTANQNHERLVERRVKEATDHPHLQTLFYRVVADYRVGGPNRRLLRLIDADTQSTPEEKDMRRCIVHAEQYLPRRLVLAAYQLDPGDLSRQNTLLNEVEVPNRIAEGRPSDIEVDTERVRRRLTFLNLKEPSPPTRPGDFNLSLAAYQQLPRVGFTVALRLWSHRASFNSWEDVRRLSGIGEMTTYLWQTAAGFTVRPNLGRTRWEPDFE